MTKGNPPPAHHRVQPRADTIVAAVGNDERDEARAQPWELIRYDAIQGQVYILGIELDTLLFWLSVAMLAYWATEAIINMFA